MLIKLENTDNTRNEWCLLEFQGEIVGDLIGEDLGRIEVKVGDQFEYNLLYVNVFRL